MVTTEIVLDGREINSKNTDSETFAVKLRVTYKRKQRYYSLKIYLSEVDFELIKERNSPKYLAKIKKQIKAAESHAIRIIEEIMPFSFDEFKKRFKLTIEGDLGAEAQPDAGNQVVNYSFGPDMVEQNDPATSPVLVPVPQVPEKPAIGVADPHPEYRGEVSIIYDHLMWKSLKRGSGGNAEAQSNSRSSILKFRANLQFSDITATFLFEYENWMLERKRSLTTVGIYLRALRAAYNEAVEWKLASEKDYPFTRHRYLVPAGDGGTEILQKPEIGLLFNCQPANHYEQRALDFWFFSYLSNGINAKDICELKYKNIQRNQYIRIDRRVKVRRTSRAKIAPIIIHLTDFHRQVICRWGNPDKDPENYIFPIFYEGISPVQQRRNIKCFTVKINKYMRKIAQRYELSTDPISSVTRPSFSTHARDAGATTEELKEMLGHSDIRTTQQYIHAIQV